MIKPSCIAKGSAPLSWLRADFAFACSLRMVLHPGGIGDVDPQVTLAADPIGGIFVKKR